MCSSATIHTHNGGPCRIPPICKVTPERCLVFSRLMLSVGTSIVGIEHHTTCTCNFNLEPHTHSMHIQALYKDCKCNSSKNEGINYSQYTQYVSTYLRTYIHPFFCAILENTYLYERMYNNLCLHSKLKIYVRVEYA